jgi:hypothetical protein
MKRKKLPSFIKHPVLVEFFQTKMGRMVSSWLMQGMLYMNKTEIIYKLSLDVIFTFAWWFLAVTIPSVTGWLIAWFLAHTTNWVINGQPVAMCRHFDWGKNDPFRFISYIEKMERRIQNRPYLAAAASFGSLSKGMYKETSDIDIRVVLGKGIIGHIRAANYCFLERARAAASLFPLDLYAFELEEMKHKMNENEVPVIFSDPLGLISNAYRETVPFNVFRQRFRRDILGERAT